MQTLQIGEITLTWLSGGILHLDGGAMFGVVPKPLWSKRYPANEQNQVKHTLDPIFFEFKGKKILIDSGIGNNKLSAKQKRNFGCTQESQIISDLKQLGISPLEIDYILMTHLHYDHACGLTKLANDMYKSTFPHAKIIVSQKEWQEMRHPNIRSCNTYWKENWQAVAEQVITFQSSFNVFPGVTMFHTGGHSDGHSIIIIENNGKKCYHLGDLLPLHAHRSPLWVTAYDDYPLDSISAKEKWITKGIQENAWFSFYHDAHYRAVKWNSQGEIVDSIQIKVD